MPAAGSAERFCVWLRGSQAQNENSVPGVGRAETLVKMLALTGVERSYASAIGQTMQNLTIQAEVGAAMESMLGDLEAWEWANKEEVLKKELEHARAQIQALKQSERDLLEVRQTSGRCCGSVVLVFLIVITLLVTRRRANLLIMSHDRAPNANLSAQEMSHQPQLPDVLRTRCCKSVFH